MRTHQEAVEFVEAIFAAFFKTHSHTDPQEWPLDQMSLRLRWMREDDLDAYRRLTEDFRHGRVDRLGRKIQ